MTSRVRILCIDDHPFAAPGPVSQQLAVRVQNRIQEQLRS